MNNYTFIDNLDVSSTHMDEGGSCTVVKIVSALILIIEKKSLHAGRPERCWYKWSEVQNYTKMVI